MEKRGLELKKVGLSNEHVRWNTTLGGGQMRLGHHLHLELLEGHKGLEQMEQQKRPRVLAIERLGFLAIGVRREMRDERGAKLRTMSPQLAEKVLDEGGLGAPDAPEEQLVIVL